MKPDSIPVFTELFSIDSINPIDAIVFGAVWFYSFKGKKEFTKAPQTLADQLNVSHNTVRDSIKKLVNFGLIESTTPGIRNATHHYRFTAKSRQLLPERLPEIGNQELVTNKQEVTRIREPRLPEVGNQTANRLPDSGIEKNKDKKLNKKEDATPEKISHSHPAIEKFQHVFERNPRKNVYRDIAEAVGDDPVDIEFWGKVLTGWKLSPYSPVNYKGMIECFREKKIPGTNRNGAHKNAHQKNVSRNSSGSSLDQKPTFNPATGETVAPRA